MKTVRFAIAALALSATGATAQDAVVTDQSFKAECSACHMAYPPNLLPASSWSAIMSGLKEHFGEDASLDEKLAADISLYLLANAGKDSADAIKPDGTPVLRISERTWFVRAHSEEVSPAQLKKAGSFANCTACHQGAENGRFGDD
ncbi:MAG: hypothetical protein WCC66_03390 [Rhizobiaceae bacterium]